MLALESVNLPKFLSHDIPLFQGILSDLFPGLEAASSEYADIRTAVAMAADSAGLVAESAFVTRCVQLWDTTRVRHGVMVIGPAGTGKSSVLRACATGVTALSSNPTAQASYPSVSGYLAPVLRLQ